MGVFNFLAIASIICVVSAQDFIIESPRVTNWGAWGQMELCQNNSFVFGFRLKVEEDQGTFSDDTALNGIQLLCIEPGAKRPPKDASISAFHTIMSIEGEHGSHTAIQECPMPAYAIGFQLKSEKDQGALVDDTAGNSLRLFCSTGEVLEGDGEEWGDWTEEIRCPRGTTLCGIKTQVEGPNPDETGLNNVDMGCCVSPPVGNQTKINV